ncbi:hypothetical protein [Pedobacter faecalis]|uniref:hypothetical protein n=1 Tax=Pedobacter faecalis TaxID=3041495 RepID=UPI00254B7BCB|nr:hypothetical protein [Pedobacter sp. ELA7]
MRHISEEERAVVAQLTEMPVIDLQKPVLINMEGYLNYGIGTWLGQPEYGVSIRLKRLPRKVKKLRKKQGLYKGRQINIDRATIKVNVDL